MARVPALTKFARRHKLLMITIADLIRYRMRTEGLVTKVAEADLPTEHGVFRIHGFESIIDKETHLALVCGELGKGDDVLHDLSVEHLNVAHGRDAGERILGVRPRPTAVVCDNDLVALGVRLQPAIPAIGKAARRGQATPKLAGEIGVIAGIRLKRFVP